MVMSGLIIVLYPPPPQPSWNACDIKLKISVIYRMLSFVTDIFKKYFLYQDVMI